jgi:predicted DNA binding CopG/RHH family protein
MKRRKKIPTFRSEEEEREFWERHDTAEYVDWSKAGKVRFPKLKKSTKTISIRLPEDMLEKIKMRANALDIPYQSLIKMWLDENLKKTGS